MAPSTFTVTATVMRPDGTTPETGYVSIEPINETASGGDVISEGEIIGTLVAGILKNAAGTAALTLVVNPAGYMVTEHFGGDVGTRYPIPGNPGGGTFDLSAVVRP